MKTLKNNIFMLKYVLKYTPAFFIWTIVEALVWGCLSSFSSVVFVKALFDVIGGSATYYYILVYTASMAVFFICAYLVHELYWKYIEPRARQDLHKYMQSELFKKAREIDLVCYDTPSFYTDFVWAINEADNRAIGIVEDIGKVINYVVSSVIIVGVLLSIDFLITLVICTMVATTVWLKFIKAKINFKRDLELKPLQRKTDYIGRVFYLADYTKEIRLSDVSDILHREFDYSTDKIIQTNKKYSKKLFIIDVFRDISRDTMISFGVIFLLCYKMMVEKSISLGDFAASIGAVWKLFKQINNLVDYLAKFKEHSLYAEKFKTFLNYKAVVCNQPDAKEFTDEFIGLSLNGISFCYPNTKSPVLDHISLNIKPKQKIALVGYNGAGKSTLIKLIMRLYEPTQGNILINGKNIQKFTLSSYRNIFSPVFQDYQIFAASVAENVIANEYKDNDYNRIINALNKSGFSEKLKDFPNGIHTILTREFDSEGKNISGGEAQKIAIARIFAKFCDIVILDEPSSALDPISEYDLNEMMMAAAFDKTVIFISHRLSTTKMADVIYMMENGRIIEKGSHDELMVLNGKYAQMFLMQAEKYNL